MLRTLLILATAVILALSPSNNASAAVELNGTFALQGGEQKTAGHLKISSNAGSLRAGFDFWQTSHESNDTVREYTIDAGMDLHMIIVAANFNTFLHLHPALQPDGHFLISVNFPHPGRYFVYMDDHPLRMSAQVFRFSVDIGAIHSENKSLQPTGRTVNTGPYSVSLSDTALKPGSMTMLVVHVRKNGKRANDLKAYLGACAHAVFINEETLHYIHVHPMALNTAPGDNMATMDLEDLHGSVSPDMMLHVVVPEPGIYKLWFQFLGDDRLYAAPFILTARR
jgi:hypothetical protein